MTGTNPSALNILSDVVISIEGTTGGDNGNATRTGTGSPVTILCDTVKVQSGRTTADHSTAQQGTEFPRINKLPQSISFETKLENKASAALLGALLGTTGVVVLFTITADGANVSGQILIENIDWDYAGPSTIRFGGKPYGVPFTITNT